MRVFFLSILMLFAFMCGQAQTERSISDRVQSAVVGKNIGKSLSQVIPAEDVPNPPMVLLMYNGSDCGSCIDASFQIAKKIDTKFGHQKVFVVGIMANKGSEQARYKYYNYIYSDAKDLIRKELKFIPTPAFIRLDEHGVIKDVLLPKDTLNPKIKKFIDNIR